ncbi:hypothetical protein NDU88_005619 [Pleurodeles waltl]|uniref:Uncharacterized protein n=1 Tax=Pleurodeles waltl TaxID=8319 RepID=A0AAV7TXN6_PLEWA|nr:hypothetical protein NDU88_005619 [Pleurodeles waltl]
MMKMNNGLSAGGGLGEEDAGEDATGERERKREPPRRPANEGPKNSSVKDTATRKEVPEGRELRHVPGGTWLNQTHRYFRYSYFRSTWKTHGDYPRLSRGTLRKKKTM